MSWLYPLQGSVYYISISIADMIRQCLHLASVFVILGTEKCYECNEKDVTFSQFL